MLTRQLLSVPLLIAGIFLIQRANAGAKVLGNCEGVTLTDCASTAVTYCLHTDGKIYGVQVEGTQCAPPLTSGVHVFDSSSKKEINLSGGYIESTDAENLVLYQCSASGCLQTVGYAKIDTYTKLTGDEPDDWGASCTNYYSAPETAVSISEACTEVTYAANSFYKKETLYYKISKEGATSDSNSVACTAADIGKFTSASGVCLGVKVDTTTTVSTTLTGTTQYILTGTLASGTVFSYSSKDGILITEGTNIIYHDVTNDVATPMLFNVDTKKTQAITGDISTEATKLLLFECQSGLCTRTAGYVKDGKETPNFYELTTSVSKLMIATDYAESCTTENSGKLVTTTNKLCINIGNSDVKEIDFPGSSGRYIISSGNSGFKTIRTVSGIISMNGIIETGKYVVKSDGVTIAITADSSDKGYLINCTNGSCTKVENPSIGFFKQGSTYYQCNGLSCSYLGDLTGVSNCSSIGQMKVGALICLDTTGGSEKTAGVVASGVESKYYLVHYDPASVFASSMNPGEFGVLKATENDITLDTTITGDKCVDANFVVTTKDGSCSNSEYSCTSGICVAAKALPICDDTSSALCNKAGGSVTLIAGDYCINQAKTDIYKAEAGVCTKENLSQGTYKIFKCTSKNKCVDVSSGIASLTGTENLLLYYFDKALSQKNNGFYYLASQRLIYCPAGSNNGACAKVITKGHYVNTGNSNENDKEAKPLLTIASNDDASAVAKASIMTETYYLDATSLGSDGKYSKIIYCVDNVGTLVCTSQTPREGYYLNASKTDLTDSLINCRGNPVKCEIKAATNDYSYIDEGHKDYIISCSAGSCTTNPGSKLQGHGYVDGTTTTNPNVMITYDRTSSKFKQTTLTLTASGVHYVNALDPKQLTTCKTTGGCTSGNASPAFYDDNTDSNHILTCTADGCISSIALTRCKTVAPSAYCTYEDGSSGTDLPVGRFCIHTDGKIYKSIDGDCQAQGTQGSFLFKANGNFYESITLDTSYTGNDSGLIYECKDNGGITCSQVISSSIVVGDNKYMYSCDKEGLCSKKTSVNPGYYLVGSPSVVSEKSYLSYGKLLKCTNTLLNICVLIDTGTDPVTANDNYIDAASSDNIITCPGTTSCYSSAHGASATEPKYYIDGENKLNIITCNGSGCTLSPGSQLQGHAYISGTDLSKKTMIKYNGSSAFVTEVITEEKYYIDGSNPKYLITCTVSGGCFSGTPSIPSGSTIRIEDDALADDGQKITCSEEGCISAKIITECAKVDNGKCYTTYPGTVLAANKFCIYTDGKIYKSTNADGTCTAQEDTLLLKDNTGFEADTLDTGSGMIYSCASGTCSQIISSHYLDSTNNKLYSCDKDGTCSKATTIGLGYYVLGVPTVSSTAPFHTYSELLKCTGNNLDNCEKITSITDGNFIDVSPVSLSSPADPTNVIACISKSKSCSIQAGSQVSGYAYIDANDSSHQSLIIYDGSTSLVSILGSQLPGHAYIDASDPSNKFVITCTEYGCTSEDKIKNLAAGKKLYFINGSDPTYLITCEKNRGSCSVGSAAQTEGVFEDGTDNTHTIMCTSTGCISFKSISKCSAVTSTAKCKYDNNETPTDLDVNHHCINSDGKIYKSATASSCAAVASGTYLIKSDGTAEELNDSYTGTDSGIIFSCSNSVCIPIIFAHFLGPNVSANSNKPTYMYDCDANGQCTKMTTIKAGIYVNGKPTISSSRSDLTYSSLVKCTETEVSSCSSVDISASSDKYYIDIDGTLIKCNTSVCERMDYPAHGYYINTGDTTTNKYIQCSGNGCKAIPEPTADCTASTIGQLVKSGSEFKLCLGYGASAILSQKIDIGAASEYLVNYYSSSIFKSYVSKSEYFGIVKVTGASSIVLDSTNVVTVHCYSDTDLTSTVVQTGDTCLGGSSKYICNTDGVCIKETVGDVTNKVAPSTIPRIKKEKEEEEDTGASSLKIECEVLNKGKNCHENTYYLVNKDNQYSIAEDEGSLFYCGTEGNDCTEIFDIGYYVIDKKTIYSCKEGQDGSTECSKSEVTEAENACNASTLGKIFLNQDKLSICFEYVSGGTPKEYSIELNVANSGNYIIHKDATNLFGLSSQQDYAIVSVKDRIITINKNYDNKLKYVYANKSGKMKLIEKGDTCPPKTGGGFDVDNIMELDCTQGKCKEVSASP